jgi:hypothetical protein
MIRPAEYEAWRNKLGAHFGQLLEVRPPVPKAEIGELVRLTGPLPPDLAVFFDLCDGVNVHVEGAAGDVHLWHTHEIEAALCNPPGPAIGPGLIPIRGDIMGECDCVIAWPGPVQGVVVRWDTWSTGVGLMASSFGKYLDNWAEYLIAAFFEDGTRRCAEPAPFDEAFTTPRDPALKAIAERHEIVKWLRAVDHCLTSGADRG